MRLEDGTMNGITEYDPNKLMESVQAKIRAEFVALVPAEQWAALVKKAVDSFFQRNERAYNDGDKRSTFEKLVHQVVEDDVKSRIRTYLDGQEWTARWTDGRQTISEEVERAIKNNAGAFMAALVGGLVQASVEEMKNRLIPR